MPKYLWRPYRRAVKDLEHYKEVEDRLIEKTGFDIDTLLEAVEAGWILQPPELTDEQKRLLEDIYDRHPDAFDGIYPMSADEIKRALELSEKYYHEPTITTDENGQMRITEVN